MEDKVKLGISVDNSGTQQVTASVKSYKQQLREAVIEAQKLSSIDMGSKEALAAQKRVAVLKEEISDLNERVDALSPEKKFAAFAQVGAGIAGGFAAAQGAAALFGGESKNLEKSLLKVQGALAFAQGLNQVMSLGDAFKNVKSVITGGVIPSLFTMKGALIATGVGAFAVALGLIIANFDKIVNAIENAFPGFKELTGMIDTNTDALEANIEANKKAQETFKKVIDIRLAMVKDLEEREIKVLKEQARRDQADADRAGGNAMLKQSIEQKLQFDIAEVEEKYRKERLEKDKAAAAKRKALRDQEYKNYLDYIQRLRSADSQEAQAKTQQSRDEYNQAKEKSEKEIALVEDLRARSFASVEDEKVSFDERGKMLKQYLQNGLITKQEFDTEEEKLETAKRDYKIECLQAVGGVMDGLMALAGDNAEAGKALAATSSIISTLAGFAKCFEQGGVVGFITGAAVLIAGFGAVTKILNTKVPNVGQSKSFSAPSVTPPTFSAHSQKVEGSGDVKAGSTQQNTPQRVYVLESDITKSQNKVSVAESRSKF